MSVRSAVRLPKRGEIWFVDPDFVHGDPDNTFGEEINKRRPVVVISSDAFANQGVRIAVPFTSWQDKFEPFDFHYRVDADATNRLRNDSSLNVLQVRCLSVLRFEEYVGRLSQDHLENVVDILGFTIDASFS